jgi:TPR repeat protein
MIILFALNFSSKKANNEKLENLVEKGSPSSVLLPAEVMSPPETRVKSESRSADDCVLIPTDVVIKRLGSSPQNDSPQSIIAKKETTIEDPLTDKKSWWDFFQEVHAEQPEVDFKLAQVNQTPFKSPPKSEEEESVLSEYLKRIAATKLIQEENKDREGEENEDCLAMVPPQEKVDDDKIFKELEGQPSTNQDKKMNQEDKVQETTLNAEPVELVVDEQHEESGEEEEEETEEEEEEETPLKSIREKSRAAFQAIENAAFTPKPLNKSLEQQNTKSLLLSSLSSSSSSASSSVPPSKMRHKKTRTTPNEVGNDDSHVHEANQEYLSEFKARQEHIKSLFDSSLKGISSRSLSNWWEFANPPLSNEQLVQKAKYLLCHDNNNNNFINSPFIKTDSNDAVEAVECASQAAHKGNKLGQYLLGCAYRHGLGGLSVNYYLASIWLTKAARQGCDKAAINLAWLYETGGYKLRVSPTRAFWW